MIAIAEIAAKWFVEYGSCQLTVSPKRSRSAQTVMNVEQAVAPALNTQIRTFLLMRIDAQIASAVASTIAASPPNSSNARKMKVSETEICARTRGIGMLR